MNLSFLRLLGKSLKSFSLLGAMVGVACLVETAQFGRFGLFLGNERAVPLDAIRRARRQPSRDYSSGRAGQSLSQQIVLGEAQPGSLYAVTVWVKDPAQMQGNDAVRVAVADVSGTVAEKWLHSADLDFYLTLRPRVRGPAVVTLTAPEGTKLPAVGVAFKPVPIGGAKLVPRAAHLAEPVAGPTTASTAPAFIAAQPNTTWETAQPFEFGRTIYGSADARPYAPAPAEDAYAAMLKGFQWFRFTFRGTLPCLAYFVLNITDRDVPLDVDIFQLGQYNGKTDVVPYSEGEFVYQIEATQNYPGLYKFRTRILKPGETYYVRVDANHPSWQLRTYDYPIPPYKDPRQSVRTGMDFLVNMGDTWLSNTPRRGSVALRTSMAYAETQLCIACHPTQFTTRGYLTAVHNGYPPTQRPAIEFLADRLYNNARPLYGEPNTNWVRVIYSARTVASRLPLLAQMFESEITRDPPRPKFAVPYADFLKIHYKDVKTLPGNETDGCEPEVSPFEIATQSWQTFDMLYRQTGDEQWLRERDNVEKLAVPYKPENMIDLNWKIHFLATLGPEQHAVELDGLIDQLYSYQRPDGMWPYPFDKQAKPADFISYHAILALALAGRRPETDEHLARAVQACLAAQRLEGSWEGDPVYQGFNTPFRATQFAVMALSTLYPGPLAPGLPETPSSRSAAPAARGSEGRGSPAGAVLNGSAPARRRGGWEAGSPAPPAQLATNALPRLLDQLDQFWDLAPEPALRQIRNVLLTSDQPLAREGAARALGHMADPGSMGPLITALGDPSKMVQSTAAWALRMILSRPQDAAPRGRTLLAAALRSPDARRRWGATRLFNQHFKYLTDDPALLAALEERLNDPVPFVRFQAASGLWRWYYWKVDDRTERTGILEALATRLNTETNPMVRRGLHESIYDVLDENTGYMAAWIKTAATQEDKDRISKGYETVVRDQAMTLARVLSNSTALGREGILTALWDFHTRHMALPPVKENTVSIGLPDVFTKYVSGVTNLHRPGYEYPPYRETVNFKYDVHNGFYQTRVGNDSDLIHFFRSSGPELEEALIACLKGAGSGTKINVLKAGSTLSGAGDAEFALAALKLTLDPDLEVRQTVRYVYENDQRGVLNLTAPAVPDPELVKTVVNILNQGTPEGQAVVLPLLSEVPADSPWAHNPEVLAALRSLLEQSPRPQNYAEVLNAASSFESLMQEDALRNRVLEGLKDSNPEVQRAAIRITLERFIDSPAMAPLVETAFGRLGSAERSILIEEVNNPKFMRRHAGVAGGALSQDQQYFLGSDYRYKDPDFLAKPIVRQTVLASLTDPDANVRAAALDLLRKRNGIEKEPEFRAAMEKLKSDPNPRLRLISTNILAGKTLAEALKDVEPGTVLDYAYFVAKVEPILATPGPDGKACVMCHANHVIFKLKPPSQDGSFSSPDSRENYRYAMRVVDINNPQHSLILIKPTRPTDAGADVSDYYATHNGGQRWKGNESSWQYKTILEWIRGERLDAAQQQGAGSSGP